ncbi:Ubiquitin carboxyl-terminal hydrolase 7 [Caenorhabditis elegans]|uniref:Ubiquitin carboxyl-terminal hydrolase 7 n=1 Tax=Caenorhabditis elegans TaxID=6239 RepID=N1NSE3_CAEEL|nr:Ubiquitin carboxyl-terminal hydrolase 7 [Caenorhabditis elegans]CCW45971.1 Ubiquitin carboxyl-terminal hydrolase 7 [Caenorhabditis elegans]|eukprot:NP_001294688.1 Ubiquitin carboxyl-terminal hydrolase [Caenorhabditis elegans]
MQCSPDPEDLLIVPTHDIPSYDESLDPFGPEGHLSLDIDCFSKFMSRSDNRIMSKPIIVRGIPWRILAICRGSRNQQGSRHSMNSRVNRSNFNFGFFLQCNNDELLQKRGMWRCYGTAVLEVLNADGPSIQKKIHHSFHNTEVDWGFSNYDQYDTLCNPKDGYVVNDTIKLRCRFTADVPTGANYMWDSKRHTGCIGLRNQGATCYMNSILQSFYFTTGFRRAVYNMDVGTEPNESNIVLAMQRVFYELQMASEAVETNSLTRAFGWDKLDAFNQHDVQEFCRVLLDNLETKMKGTSEEKSIPNLFRGNMKSYIKCLDVDYESSRTESFYDVQLNVLGMDSLERAFEAYTTSEILDDENKYDAGDHGLQRAEKGVKFVELPPILHVQLMRFQYCGVEQKINERFSFPEKMNLASCCELGPMLTEEDCVYSLHAVLVHSGEFHGGHYVTYINVNLHESAVDPTSSAKWCKFDDDVVSRTTTDDAIVSNFGGEKTMNSSAYMLVYVRDNAIDQFLAPIPDSQIPQSVSRTFEMERLHRNREKKKLEEEQLCMGIVLVTPDIVASNHSFDLVDQSIVHDSIPHETVWKHMFTAELYQFVHDRLFEKSAMQKIDMFDSDDEARQARRDNLRRIKSKKFNFRLWRMTDSYSLERTTQKLTSRLRPSEFIDCKTDTRLDTLLSQDFETIYVEFSNNIERPLCEYDTARDLLFFVKYYDTMTDKFTIIGHTMFDCHKRFNLYRSMLCEMIGLPADTELKYYMEHAASYLELVDLTQNYSIGRLVEEQDGGILVVEKVETSTSTQNAKQKMNELFLDVEVEFVQSFYNKKPEEEPFEQFVKRICLDDKLFTVAEEIGARLNVDPKKVLIWTRVSGSRFEPFFDDYMLNTCKGLMTRPVHDPRAYKRYRVQYAIMPFDIDEISKHRIQTKLFWQLPNGHVEELTLFPLKEGTVIDIINEAKRYYPFVEGGSGKFRLLQIGAPPLSNQRVYQIYGENTLISDLDQRTMYKLVSSALHCRLEEVPIDELDMSPGEFLCPVVHFDREPTKLFGLSFVIKIRNNELMTEVRDRLRRKLNDVSDADFAKYKFALLSRDKLCRTIEFNNGEKVNLADMANQTTGVPQVYIGLDHKSPIQHSSEAAIRILN